MQPSESPSGTVVSVSRSPRHALSKEVVAEIRILAGLGVEGDAHAGATVQHLYRVRKDPNAPNLCQVHLLQEELFDELREQGLTVTPGQIGENVTVRGVDLITLPVGATLHLGPDAIVEITGLRDPCSQLNRIHPSLMKACLARASDGSRVRKAGVMGIARTTGIVRPGDVIRVQLPPLPWTKMGPV